MQEQTANQEKNAGLLEQLRADVGCNFISDLLFSPWFNEAICRLVAMPAERYSLHEWNDAVAYLLKDMQPSADAVTAQKKFSFIGKRRKMNECL